MSSAPETLSTPTAVAPRSAVRARRRSGGGSVFYSKRGKYALFVYFCLFLAFLYLPTVLLIIFSFNDSTITAFPLAGLTTKWYRLAFQDSSVHQALLASIKVAVFAGIAATLLGIMVSYPLGRRNIRGRGVIIALILLPLVVPTVVLGVALILMFQHGLVQISLGLPAIAIGHVVIALPFCVLLLLPRIAAIDKRLEEAAYDLGASSFTTFRRVILPLITPAILSSFIVAFVVSIDELVVASFLAGTQVTFPIYLYSGLKFPERTTILIPVATVMITASFLLALLAEVIRRSGERRLLGGVELTAVAPAQPPPQE
jgi:spermidine/putrescine transport system permease protein